MKARIKLAATKTVAKKVVELKKDSGPQEPTRVPVNGDLEAYGKRWEKGDLSIHQIAKLVKQPWHVLQAKLVQAGFVRPPKGNQR